MNHAEWQPSFTMSVSSSTTASSASSDTLEWLESLASSDTLEWLESLASFDHQAFIESELALGHYIVFMLLGDTCWSRTRDYEAEQVYRALLQRDPPDPLASDVQRRLEVAEDYQRKRKDPLTSLPPELFLRVLNYLSQHDRVVCTEVSKSWQAFIYCAPELWRHLFVKSNRYNGVRPFLMSQLQSLLLQTHVDMTYTLSFIAEHLCSRLKSLEIDGISTASAPLFTFDLLLSSTLPRLGQHLVHLHIATDARNEHYDTLNLILKACPMLVCLSCRGLWQVATRARAALTNVPYPKFWRCRIRFLAWPHRSILHDPDFLPTHFPELKHLDIREGLRFYPQDTTRAIQRLHEVLDLKTLNVCDEIIPDTLLPGQNGPRYDMVLSRFANLPWQDAPLCQPRYPDDRYLVLTHVDMDHTVLQTMVLDRQDSLAWLIYLPDEGSAFRHETPQTLPFTHFHFPRLTHLQLSGVLPPLFRPLHAFFDACPNLQDVRFRHIEIDQAAVHALLRTPVVRIELYESPLFYRVTDEPLMALAKGAAAQGTDCCLRYLGIAVSLMSQVFYNALLTECGHMATLRSLRLTTNSRQEEDRNGHPGIHVTDEALTLFIEHAKQSGLSESLTDLKLQSAPDDADSRIRAEFPLII
ncbi:hypothetical protein BCR43DRAFT_498270 [Syncephalastrum racemosum]|uniref:F-box domain-containing protein n=1 Tax=Syncephalastrum racemosum TaxID=13706 RepID=A0A1X2H0K5_SYNRA|nr:hypothetical protein BCR43DRAFT_498270 [Syncephalastrum racemosum]